VACVIVLGIIVYGAVDRWPEGEAELPAIGSSEVLVTVSIGFSGSAGASAVHWNRSRSYISLPSALDHPVIFTVSENSANGFSVRTSQFSWLLAISLAVLFPAGAWLLGLQPWLARRRLQPPAA
jgi:hypothetical protein